MKIVTNVVNNPVFIEIQYNLLKRYVRGGEYEFIVFNDAKRYEDYTNNGDIGIRDKIIETCERLGIKCINMDNDNHKEIKAASIRASIVMNEIHNYQMENPDRYIIMDSDMFLIDYMDIDRYDGYKVAYVLQTREEHRYMWSGLIYMDMRNVDEFRDINWFLTPTTDVGGMTRKWLERYIKIDEEKGNKVPTIEEIRWNKDGIYNTDNLYYMRHLWSLSWDEGELPENLRGREGLIRYLREDSRNKGDKYFCEIYDNIFLHYRGGCNWMGGGMTFHIEMANKLKKYII
jgi:hypothetical protein